MARRYLYITLMLFSAWAVYGYCQNDMLLALMAGCIVAGSFLLRIKSAENRFALFKRMPLSSVIIASFIVGWIWGGIFPAPELANSPIPALTLAVQSGSIFASILIFLRPFTPRNMYYLTFLAWFNVAVSINVTFTGPMLYIFCFFCIISTAIIILNTTQKPTQKKHMFRYYRDFILFSTVLIMMTTALFYGISKTIVILDKVFVLFVNDYMIPKHYTHFLKIDPQLHLVPPGRSAWDRRPVLEVTIPKVEIAYLKTQVFHEYDDGIWVEPQDKQSKPLSDTLIKGLPEGEMIMFTPLKNIIPSPSGIMAAQGKWIFTKSEDEILYSEDKQQTRILKFSLTPEKARIELTPDQLESYTKLPLTIAPELKNLSRDIVGGETDMTAKAIVLRDFFRENFKYTLSVNFRADNKGILKMIREQRPAYCSYFATALTLLLRSEGIPARMATGFLVSERIDRRRNKFLVRVNHAHAWSEVLLPQTDPATNETSYVWKTFDATPAEELHRVLHNDPLKIRRLAEKIWLGLLRLNAYVENVDKKKLKVNILAALILIIILINHKKVYQSLSDLLRRFTQKISVISKRPNKLQSIYQCYENYLKEAFNENRELTDTDHDVIERLNKNLEIPRETIAKVESFLHHYHAARFGERDPMNLEKMIESLNK